MALAALRGVRIGALTSVTITAFLLWWSVEAPWWSERTDVGGFHTSTVGLASFGGSAFAWCATAACLAFAVAAVPVRRRVRRMALAAGLAASAGSGAVWAVLLGRVVRRDADTHRGWAAEIWTRHLADGRPALAETDADGLNLALVVVFLLLVIGTVLASPRRHERDVLLIAAMVNIVAALMTTTAAAWVTSGPETAEPDWFWIPELLASAGPAVVTLALMVPILGVGLFLRPDGRVARGWRVAWAVTAGIYCYAAYFVTLIDTSSGPPFYPQDAEDSAAFPTGWGVGVSGLLMLVMFLPLVVITRVLAADSAAVRRAAVDAFPGSQLDDVLSDRVPADRPLDG